MNKLGLDVTSVGNHEFDEGYKELQRLAHGGCIDDGDGANNQNSCPTGTFPGASFDFLAANVIEKATGKTILPAYSIKNVNGAKIGFIGMTLKDTPDIVTACRRRRARVHRRGARPPTRSCRCSRRRASTRSSCSSTRAARRQAAVDQPVDGKTYQVNPTYDYACQGGGTLDARLADPADRGAPRPRDRHGRLGPHPPALRLRRQGPGRPAAAGDLGVVVRPAVHRDRPPVRPAHPGHRAQLGRRARNMLVTRDVAEGPGADGAHRPVQGARQPIAEQGHRPHHRRRHSRAEPANAGGESQLGDLIADAQLADPSVVTGGQKPVIAFMNPGGIRADLTYANSRTARRPATSPTTRRSRSSRSTTTSSR